MKTMKPWKKNLIASAVLATVCAGVGLSRDMEAMAADPLAQNTATDYFAAVRLSRQQARENAVNLLQ